MLNQSALTPMPAHLHEDQVIALLRSGAHGALLSAYFGDVEYRELSQLAKLSATRQRSHGPLVFVLPGIMGSRLAMKQKGTQHLFWLHPAAVAQGHLLKLALPGSRAMRPLGVMLPGYLKMKLMLEVGGYRPIFYPFDWRCDIERTARAFVRAVEGASVRKVMVVAHSMGGLVARAALRFDKNRRIAKLVQLGAPNEGSFAPVQALRAVYPTVRKIAALDRLHSAEELARQVFLTLPGLYQLLPSARAPEERDFFDPKNWPHDLAPDTRLLDEARKVRMRLPDADQRCHVIAGAAHETITSVEMKDGMFEYTSRCQGDGTVPLSRAHWPEARTWYANENHGALSVNDNVVTAIIDVLREGSTEHLAARPPQAKPGVVQRICDEDLRRCATKKVDWETLSLDSRRRILEPVFTPEFLASKA
jgi:pimeloyl-ACP methyl ester carboxylesterase